MKLILTRKKISLITFTQNLHFPKIFSQKDGLFLGFKSHFKNSKLHLSSEDSEEILHLLQESSVDSSQHSALGWGCVQNLARTQSFGQSSVSVVGVDVEQHSSVSSEQGLQ